MGKPDPRADPVTDPPTAKDDFLVDRVDVPKPGAVLGKLAPRATPTKQGMPRVDAPLLTESDDGKDEVESSVVRKGTANAPDDEAPPNASKMTSTDARQAALEKLLDLNDWKKVQAELGSLEDVGKLPPNLGLVAALAHNENAKDGDPEAARVAIRSMAGLLGVAEESPLARVLARRMLRKNPVRFTERQAPAARTSLLIVLATLVVGGGVGWLASIGSWRGIAALLHL